MEQTMDKIVLTKTCEPITVKMFSAAAECVKAILEGRWTNEPPQWASTHYSVDDSMSLSGPNQNYVRAVQTAEFLIIMFRLTPGFDQQAFLAQCGLVDEVVR
mgnify:CR=1 FL=1